MKDEDVHLKQHIKELTLLLLYLNSWMEKEWGFEYRRSWKGYDFGALNELAEEGVITDSRRSKSVGITEAGEKKAKELMKKYLME
ncbi:DUF6429 family protein [Effusibacillus dendaii]|uniref:DUF6429 domain-containing protein n=1 Tax=Effusibacillus dendaii TaxID=2743772 RepID=A0A7I8DAX7_9BACL|nr:DUF6429 family protein [Effusibacillus dendaii]BCJ85670.1 hypothetical protein skT53_06550 [Effusibacillus dendaii]